CTGRSYGYFDVW
nr:immunoglobulin heavy chain junction region [Mus musculus]